MRKVHSILFIFIFWIVSGTQLSFGQSIKDLLSYPYPENLTSSPGTGIIAWTFNQEGKRNIYISKDKGKTLQRITNNNEDDGQKISQMHFSPDGKWLIYLRGGAPDDDWSQNVPLNPRSMPEGGEDYKIWRIKPDGTEKKALVDTPDFHDYAISPNSREIAFIKNGQVWVASLDGSEEAHQLFTGRGNYRNLQWSPNGKSLAFVSNRKTHSYVGIYTDKNTPIEWITPSFSRDTHPKWSPKGDSLVFIRQPAIGGKPDSILTRHHIPWEIRIADIKSNSSSRLWKAPKTLRGSVPTTNGGFNLHWAANNRIIFMSTHDNWPHLYSLPSKGGKPIRLTNGNFMVEHVKLSPDRKNLIFSVNSGPDSLDSDRRHIATVAIDRDNMKVLTPGEGIEATPVYYDSKNIAYISSTVFRPPLPAIQALQKGKEKLIGKSLLSSAFSKDNFVKPRQVIFDAPDGTRIYGQLFQKSDNHKKPAILYIHGGPMRQMLLGWHYSRYYAAQYAVNQKLASMGFAVLSVNYRLGTGYGTDFYRPANGFREGASEYQDILAAGKWLANKSDINKEQIGVYGGSFGGYLTALALGRNSDIFKAGVDISGVHYLISKSHTAQFEPAQDATKADSVTWEASPIAHTAKWTSPVLLIHSDDDREVEFDHSIELLNRLKQNGNDVHYETLVIPDETHVWLLHKNLVNIYETTVDFLNRQVRN